MVAALTFATALALATSQLASCLSVPPRQRGPADKCTIKTQRKAWHRLTAVEKSDYLKATLCIMKTPAKLGIPAAKTRWDELQYIHVYQTPHVHGTGAFLPFHRYFITVHERVMRNECGYTGAMPYWDEPSDVADFAASPLFESVPGFGGNGTGSDLCIRDGPFANLTLHVRANLTSSDYCVTRNFNSCLFKVAAQSNVDQCMAFTSFEKAWHCLENNPHTAGHGGVNGLMQDVQLSPGDPIFWLHHTYLDKLWWQWQARDLGSRLTDMTGTNMPIAMSFTFGPPPNGTAGGSGTGASLPFDLSCYAGRPSPFGPPPNGTTGPWTISIKAMTPIPELYEHFNDGGNVTTLNHTLWSAGLERNLTIRDVMDIRSDFVCAEYL